MRSLTKSGIRELTAKYRSILKKCAILNAMVLMSGAIGCLTTTPANASDTTIIAEGRNVTVKENTDNTGRMYLLAAPGYSIEFETPIYNKGELWIGRNNSYYTGNVILRDVNGSGWIYVDSGNLEFRGSVDQIIDLNNDNASITIAEGGTLHRTIDNTHGTVYISNGTIRADIRGGGSSKKIYVKENKSAAIDGKVYLDNLTMENNSFLDLRNNGNKQTLTIGHGLKTNGTAYLSFDIMGNSWSDQINDQINITGNNPSDTGTFTLKDMDIFIFDKDEFTRKITLFTNENNYTINDYLGRAKTTTGGYSDYYYRIVQDPNNKSDLILTKTKQPWTFRQVIDADTKLMDPSDEPYVVVNQYFVNGEMMLDWHIGNLERYPNTTGRTFTFQGTNTATDIINAQNKYSALYISGNDTIALNNVTMKNFNSSSRGGAISNTGIFDVSTADFISNTAKSWGGAIWNSWATITSITGNFINNFSQADGGAIFNVGSGSIANIKTSDAKPNIVFSGNYVITGAYGAGGAINNYSEDSIVGLYANNGHSITFVGKSNVAKAKDVDGIYNGGILNINGDENAEHKTTGTVNLYNVNGPGTTNIYGGITKIADAASFTQNNLTISSGAKLESKADNLRISTSLTNNGTLATYGNLNNLTKLNNTNGTVQIATNKALNVTNDYTLGGTLDLNGQTLNMQDQKTTAFSTLKVNTLKGTGNLWIDAALGSNQSDKIVYNTKADNAVINITNINVKEGSTAAAGTLNVLVKEAPKLSVSGNRLLASNNVNTNEILNVGGDDTDKTTTIAGDSLYTFEKGETDGTLKVTKQEITSSSVGALSNEIEVSGSSVYVDTYSLVADEPWTEEIISNCKLYTVFMNGYNLIGGGNNNGAVISYQEGRGDEVIINGGGGTIRDLNTAFINNGVLTLNNVIFSGNKIDVLNRDTGILNLMGENTFGSKLTGTGKTTNTGTLNISADNLDLVLTNNGTLNLTEGTLTRKVLGEGKINFLNGTALTSPLDKTFIGDNKVNFAGNNIINLIVGNGLTDGEYAFISGSIEGKENTTISDNTLYDLAWSETNDGSITLAKKSTSEVVANLAKEGVNAQQAATISAFADSKAGNPVLSAITEAVQSGDVKAAAKLAEEVAPTTSQTVMGVAQSVNSILSNIAGNRMAAVGRNGGDAFVGGAMWVQGLMNHTKQDSTSNAAGFSADTNGISFGIDGKVNENLMVGFGYGYSNTDADSGQRDIDVEGHNFFAYSEYKPNNWYINGMFNYGFSQYEEQKVAGLKGKYDVNTYAANVMTGYDFDNGLTPEVGLRYLLADQESYNDGAQRIKSDKTDVLTGVAGIKYQTNMKAKDWTFTPNLRLSATYDMMSDNSKANVSVIGGGNYQITGKRLERFGVETGIGVEATYGDWNLSLDYNGGFRKDFQSHTGMLKAKYNF